MSNQNQGWLNWGDHPLVVAVGIVSGIVGIVGGIVAMRGPSAGTEAGGGADPKDAALRRAIIGRWYQDGPASTAPERPRAVGHSRLTWDFDPNGAVTLTAHTLISDYLGSKHVEVSCSGLARGKWSISARTLSTNLTEDLFVALDGAVEDNVSINSALARSKGYSCPDMPLAARGSSQIRNVLELDDKIMRVDGDTDYHRISS
jgi:hypothetical protein